MSQTISRTQRSFLTGFPVLLCAVSLLILAAVSVSAQASNPNSGSTPSGLKPGAPAGSYSLSGFENINLYNGNLNFHLPLLGIGGRGNARMQMMVAVDSVHWTVNSEGGLISDITPNWWSPLKVGYGPGVLQGRGVMWTTEQTNITTYLPRLTFTAPDGTEYELRDKATNGQPIQHGTNRGKIFISTDGTAVTFISDIDILDNDLEDHFYPTGWLLLADGTRYRIGNTDGSSGGLVMKIIDRNGNLLSFTYDSFNRVSTITDSLNRQVSIEYDLTTPYRAKYYYDLITYKGFGGAARWLKVWHTNLGLTLRSDYSGTMSYAALFPGLTADTTKYNSGGMATSVELPDGRTYELRYNPWGELARVELPTGGAIEYDFDNFAGTDFSQGIHRRVTERRVYKDKNDPRSAFESRQAYTKVYTTSPQRRAEITVKAYDVSGNMLSHEKHYFEGNPVYSLSIVPTDYSWWKDGREWKTQSLSLVETGAVVLREVQMTWQQSTSTSMGLNQWWTSGYQFEPTMNPHVVETITTLMDSTPNKVSKQTAINPVTQAVGFDQYNNQTDLWETDYGDGVTWTWLRHTHTDYLTTNTINGTSYNYDTIAVTSGNPDVANTIHIRRLSKEQLVYSVNSTTGADVSPAADTKFYYDQSALQSYTDIIGLDSAYTASRTARGNMTRTSRWRDLPTSAWLNADTEYDIAGNVTRTIDARGNATSFNFSDCFGSPNGEAQTNTPPTELGMQKSYAMVTSITNALNQTSHSQYDFSIGLPVDEEDINGVVSSDYYTNAQGQTDPLDRPFKTVKAVGTSVQSQLSFSYDDANRIVTVISDKENYNDGLLKSETLYDKLGRLIETHTYENATAYITSKQEYDALGRVKRAYNPYRTTADPTYGWTDKSYDAFGRVVLVKTSDNAQITAVYENNRLTVTDQAGKQRRSILDAQGRLTQIIEDPSSLNYQTNYTYDVLNNLHKVEQGAQSRYFMYDSLSRLIRTKNPEQDVNSSITPSLTDPMTNQNGWSIASAYDSNGNLETRTDARNITTTYAYDELNRNTTVTYSQNAGTSNIINRYDPITAYGKGRLWQSETTGDSGTLMTFNSFDAAGRPLSQSQQFKSNGSWSAAYTSQRTYKITGSISTDTYPSGHTVSYIYDDAGRLQSFTGSLGDGVSRTYSSNISYDAGGRMLEERFGTQTPLYQKLRYNIRGQLYDIRLSTLSFAQSATDWDRGCLAFYYSLNNQTWGGSGTDNNGNVTKAESYIPNPDGSYNMLQDQYAYDSLNRLQSVGEYQWGTQNIFTQIYDYDRYGNRTINQSSSSNINKLPFTVNTANNRLGVPTGQSGQVTYDAAGNLTTDTYSRADTARTYDGENRLITNTNTSNQVSRYTYDAAGRRVRRNINNQETWQVYGMGGELLAEYAANASPANAQKEYGYRGTEILITATNTSDIQWLVSDHLGTPRMIVDKTGSLSGVKRHDYLPFGEEIFAGTGGRSTTQGYVGDSVRQKFAAKERDDETTLDFFEVRYYSSAMGRFINSDPIVISNERMSNPQIWNLYSYVGNNPLAYSDPNGMERIRLGQHTDKELEDSIKEKDKQIDAAKKAKDKTKAEELEKEKAKLKLELEGQKVVEQLLKDLKSIKEQGTLKVSDFTLSTDPAEDFKKDGIKGDPSNGGSGAMFSIKGFSNEIYINTNSKDFKGAVTTANDASKEDYTAYLASGAAHERFHLSNDPKAGSEKAAYNEQFRVVQSLRNSHILNSTNFYNNTVLKHINDGISGKFGP